MRLNDAIEQACLEVQGPMPWGDSGRYGVTVYQGPHVGTHIGNYQEVAAIARHARISRALVHLGAQETLADSLASQNDDHRHDWRHVVNYLQTLI